MLLPRQTGYVLHLLSIIAVAAAAGLPACSGARRPVRPGLQTARSRDITLADPDRSATGPTQVGMTLSGDLVDQLARHRLRAAIETRLSARWPIDVGAGQIIGVRTDVGRTEVDVDISAACNACIRVSADIDATAVVAVPGVGRENAALDASATIVAPLIWRSTGPDANTVGVDLSAAADIGQSSVDARLDGVAAAWARALAPTLSTKLLAGLTGEAEAVDLWTFVGPDAGIDDLDLAPTEVSTHAETETIFVGFTTNIAGLPAQPALTPLKDIGEAKNLAIHAHDSLVAAAMALMLQRAGVARPHALAEPLVDAGQPLVSIAHDQPLMRSVGREVTVKQTTVQSADGVTTWRANAAVGPAQVDRHER